MTTDPVPSAPRAADGEWHRVHPLTPAVHSWQALVVLLVVAVQDVGQSALRQAGGVEGDPRPDASWLRAGIPIVLAIAVVVVGLLVLSWRFTRYRVTAEALELRHGVMWRTVVVVPYGRMQYVDVYAGPVDRAFGLAKVQLHTASARSDAYIPGLGPQEAARLRDRLASRGEARLAGL